MSSHGAPAVRPASREIARAAVQAELSLAAYELVVEKGYGNVTLDDMAAAGGVSRSTFLRYFRTKDQAILVALKAYVERMADALRARPREEDDWSALRSAIESFVVPIYTLNPAGAQDLSRLALFTRALSGAHLDLADWRAPLTRALAERHGEAELAALHGLPRQQRAHRLAQHELGRPRRGLLRPGQPAGHAHHLAV